MRLNEEDQLGPDLRRTELVSESVLIAGRLTIAIEKSAKRMAKALKAHLDTYPHQSHSTKLTVEANLCVRSSLNDQRILLRISR